MFYELKNKIYLMYEMTLAFPDSHTMAEFVIGKNVSGIVVNSDLNTVRGIMSDGLIETACNDFQASLLHNNFSNE